MTPWSDEETRELVALWPSQSATQIAKRLQRPRWSVCAKAHRLRQEGLLDGGITKRFAVPPLRVRPRTSKPRINPQLKSAPAKTVDDVVEMRPCSILELDATRCHWPLGDVETIAVMFCGGVAVPGRRYCAHHLRRATGKGGGNGSHR